MIRLIALLVLLFFVEIYSFQAFKTIIDKDWVLLAYKILNVTLGAFILFSFSRFDRSVGQTQQTLFVSGLLMLIYVPKLMVSLVMFGEDVLRMGGATVRYFANTDTDALVFSGRRKFISQIGFGLAAVPLLS